jgi:hypothetical protein
MSYAVAEDTHYSHGLHARNKIIRSGFSRSFWEITFYFRNLAFNPQKNVPVFFEIGSSSVARLAL